MDWTDPLLVAETHTSPIEGDNDGVELPTAGMLDTKVGRLATGGLFVVEEGGTSMEREGDGVETVTTLEYKVDGLDVGASFLMSELLFFLEMTIPMTAHRIVDKRRNNSTYLHFQQQYLPVSLKVLMFEGGTTLATTNARSRFISRDSTSFSSRDSTSCSITFQFLVLSIFIVVGDQLCGYH